ncbi:hypothetical protein TNCV_1387691 [Trichonephila clavipes]|nr:hypothetical protein TNCV_1387691 [Trichonephila clavipes]
MYDSSSFANPTPLAHADTSRDVLPRGGTSQIELSSEYQSARMLAVRSEANGVHLHSLWPRLRCSDPTAVNRLVLSLLGYRVSAIDKGFTHWILALML